MPQAVKPPENRFKRARDQIRRGGPWGKPQLFERDLVASSVIRKTADSMAMGHPKKQSRRKSKTYLTYEI